MAALTNEEILEAIKEKSVLELNELVKMIQDEFGVTPMAMAAPAAAGPAAGEAAAEEKTTFDVVLTSFGEKKIQVIKAVRELTSLGLKEAKELVEGVPKSVKDGVPKEEAEEAKKTLEEAGGSAELK
jgi:large subunit ribosomal protein L7/L12